MTDGPAPETVVPTALEIQAGTPLAGVAVVDGSKNAALPLLAAAACLQQQVELWGVPACEDIEVMLSLLQRLGWAVSLRRDLSKVTVARVHPRGVQPDLAEAAAIRASYYLVAPLITAYGVLGCRGRADVASGSAAWSCTSPSMRRSAITLTPVPAVTPCGLRAARGRGAARYTSLCHFAAVAPLSPHCCARW